MFQCCFLFDTPTLLFSIFCWILIMYHLSNFTDLNSMPLSFLTGLVKRRHFSFGKRKMPGILSPSFSLSLVPPSLLKTRILCQMLACAELIFSSKLTLNWGPQLPIVAISVFFLTTPDRLRFSQTRLLYDALAAGRKLSPAKTRTSWNILGSLFCIRCIFFPSTKTEK